MCGICGIWGEGSRRIEPMLAALDHRGPDDRGIYADDRASLAMARLSILDVSPAGHQPMRTPDGEIVIVYNGETYNFREERRALEACGVTFGSGTDTEVVLRMYEHYGDDFLLRLRGMFAIAIYDRRGGPGRERLLLARDHLGIKPLLYTHVQGRLLFSSELKSLLASGIVDRDIDPVALRQLLTYGSVLQPRTIIRGVSMLPPAHRLIADSSGERIERYWSLAVDRRQGLRDRDYEEIVDEVSSVLEESVRLQTVSDVPLGAFLSGGVDSSLVVAMLRNAVQREVKTFSVGFEAEGRGIDESADAERMARYLGTDHTAVIVRGEEVRDRIEHIAWSLDQPSVDGVNSYFVSLAARQSVTVAMSGTGGDELFAGYPWFIGMALHDERASGEPLRAAARGLIASAARHRLFDPLMVGRGARRLQTARTMAGFTSLYAGEYAVFSPHEAARLLPAALRGAAQAGRSASHDLDPIDELRANRTIERVTGLALRGYLNNQLLRDIDVMSMAHSLEVRVPFLDPVVVDTALSLPDAAKLADISKQAFHRRSTYRESGAKRVLIDIGCRMLPEGYDNQPKRGFAMPFRAWMNGPLHEIMQETLSADTVRRRGLLDPEMVATVRDRFATVPSEWYKPWLLMMIELWCRQVLDTPAGAASGQALRNVPGIGEVIPG